MQQVNRVEEARYVLIHKGVNQPVYIGHGCEGVVFHDHCFVYKVYDHCKQKEEIKRRVSFFLNLYYTETLYRIEECADVDDAVVIKYRYEESSPCHNYTEAQAITFLTECFLNKICVRDCKPHNFIQVDDSIKLVDMEACNYTDNLFLNMCVRMYLYVHYFDLLPKTVFQKLKRSAINNFDLPELQGVREFVNKVFEHIIAKQSETVRKQRPPLLPCVPIEHLQEKVSLLIKTCAQDELTIETNIRHIVKQLSSPNPFYEVLVSIDTKQGNFLREYNSKGNVENVIRIANRLKEEKIIDDVIVFDDSQTEAINMRWFNLPCKYAHTASQIPVAPQLYAFEHCRGDYILQMDSDVLIGRKDYSHSFLSDMIGELKKNETVLSVGFNINNRESKAYFGFENGGFVPEVRMGLFDKKRFFDLRPYPNSMDANGRLALSWHRSVEQFQKQTGYCSIRGGNHRSFYIHPQNYRKKHPYAWLTMMDRVEQLQIPDIQYGEFDLAGSYYEWCIPKRNEKMVVVSCFRNVTEPRFLRFWYSLLSQSYQQFGIVLYDDCSDNGLSELILRLIQPYKDRVTFISAKYKDARMANVYRAIHYYCNNPESIIVMVDGDDALIGNDVLEDVLEKYDLWENDVVLGRVHQTYRLQPHYRYPANFSAPRANNGGNVYQHLKTFKKYLFDSIPHSYFKYDKEDKARLTNSPWLETCDDYAFMIPIVEMSSNPYQMDNINYFYERDYEHRNANRDVKERCIAEIINKPPLSPQKVHRGRIIFRPDFQRIEIDITYDCNLKCIGCNRSCAQAPTKEQMSVVQIKQFVAHSVAVGKKWEMINILGGEPTLHKDFLTIIALLQQYADKHSPKTIIKIVSNGVNASSRQLCEKARQQFANVVIDYDSYKTTNKIDYFSPFNDAPVDDPTFKDSDYVKGCWVTQYCGIGLNARGYYACAVCGAIDRVLDGNNGVADFEHLTEQQLCEHYNRFCRLCGNYKHYAHNAGDYIPRCEKAPFTNIVSKTWQKIYKLNM